MALVGFAPTASPVDLEAAQLLPAALGGFTYFVVNQLLVVVVVALKVGRPWWVLLREDLAYEGVSNAALLALSPLIVLAVEEGTAFLPLLLPPLVVVYGVGAVALDRERQAMTDALTGLPNRKRLAERAAEAFEEALDGGSPGPALLLFDLDRFKEVNDTLGHHVGDHLLVLVGSRLTAAVREVDTVARLGGDEFAVLLPGTGGAAAEQTARRLLAELAEPIVLEGAARRRPRQRRRRRRARARPRPRRAAAARGRRDVPRQGAGRRCRAVRRRPRPQLHRPPRDGG
jgi:diguanylate cyclase (GGDEF)-like protein